MPRTGVVGRSHHEPHAVKLALQLRPCMRASTKLDKQGITLVSLDLVRLFYASQFIDDAGQSKTSGGSMRPKGKGIPRLWERTTSINKYKLFIYLVFFQSSEGSFFTLL